MSMKSRNRKNMRPINLMTQIGKLIVFIGLSSFIFRIMYIVEHAIDISPWIEVENNLGQLILLALIAIAGLVIIIYSKIYDKKYR